MSAKSKGIRYTPQKKAEVVNFVHAYNAKNGRGGQSAAAAKFGITQLTISAWLKKTGSAPKTGKAAAKSAAGDVGKVVKDLLAAINLAAKQLAKIKA